jgi:hypothetical protein
MVLTPRCHESGRSGSRSWASRPAVRNASSGSRCRNPIGCRGAVRHLWYLVDPELRALSSALLPHRAGGRKISYEPSCEAAQIDVVIGVTNPGGSSMTAWSLVTRQARPSRRCKPRPRRVSPVAHQSRVPPMAYRRLRWLAHRRDDLKGEVAANQPVGSQPRQDRVACSNRRAQSAWKSEVRSNGVLEVGDLRDAVPGDADYFKA